MTGGEQHPLDVLAAAEPSLGAAAGEDVALEFAAQLSTVTDATVGHMAQALLATNVIIARRLGRIETLLANPAEDV